MYEELKKTNEEIIKAKEKFDNEVLNVIKKVIEESNQKIEEEKLGPIQSYTLIMKCVNETLNNIKIECGMDLNEELDENIMNQIYEMTDQYEEKIFQLYYYPLSSNSEAAFGTCTNWGFWC